MVAALGCVLDCTFQRRVIDQACLKVPYGIGLTRNAIERVVDHGVVGKNRSELFNIARKDSLSIRSVAARASATRGVWAAASTSAFAERQDATAGNDENIEKQATTQINFLISSSIVIFQHYHNV